MKDILKKIQKKLQRNRKHQQSQKVKLDVYGRAGSGKTFSTIIPKTWYEERLK